MEPVFDGSAAEDANGSHTQSAYDNQGRLVTKTYADATTYTYTYDAGGRMLTHTDAKGVTTAYAYDALGRLLAVDYPNDPDIAYTPRQSRPAYAGGVGRRGSLGVHL